jgi:hypothetical protein
MPRNANPSPATVRGTATVPEPKVKNGTTANPPTTICTLTVPAPAVSVSVTARPRLIVVRARIWVPEPGGLVTADPPLWFLIPTLIYPNGGAEPPAGRTIGPDPRLRWVYRTGWVDTRYDGYLVHGGRGSWRAAR